MPYIKKVVCLANSRKWYGYCFAGKEMFGAGYGSWIRPVSDRKNEEISEKEQTFANGDRPRILDVVTIPMIAHRPVAHQRENHLIATAGTWKKTSVLDRRKLPALLDSVPGALWVDGSSSGKGFNDRISPGDMQGIKTSLLLIQPENLSIRVYVQRRQVRADFTHNGNRYNLSVTDPVIISRYQQMSGQLTEQRRYSLAGKNIYLCISLAERPCQDYYYKLAAGFVGDIE